MTPSRRIVYAGFATRQRSGGVHVLTEHVQMLRAAGHEAWLWLPDPGDRTDWIDPGVPVLSGSHAAHRRGRPVGAAGDADRPGT